MVFLSLACMKVELNPKDAKHMKRMKAWNFAIFSHFLPSFSLNSVEVYSLPRL